MMIRLQAPIGHFKDDDRRISVLEHLKLDGCRVEWNLQSWLRRHINGLAGPFSGTACGALPCGMAMISRGILFHHDASRHGSLPALGASHTCSSPRMMIGGAPCQTR
jgi:hypothetical protein